MIHLIGQNHKPYETIFEQEPRAGETQGAHTPVRIKQEARLGRERPGLGIGQVVCAANSWPGPIRLVVGDEP